MQIKLSLIILYCKPILNPYSDNLLNRLCNKTEFEVAGWRQLSPLMGFLQTNIPFDVIQRMELKLHLIEGQRSGPYTTIKNSWIYDHFKRPETKNIKIAIFVNSLFRINENLNEPKIESDGNHFVLAKGIMRWKSGNDEIVEYLELETHDKYDQTRFIPVECPFYEEVQENVNKILQDHPEDKSYNESLNKYGETLAQIMMGSQLDTNWYNEQKYHMLFVRAEHPSFQLKFTA